MIGSLQKKLKAVERRLNEGWDPDLGTASERRRAYWHFQLVDHAFLRALWTNEAEIAPGVFRSNQPSPKRFSRLAARGFRTILNMRGVHRQPYYFYERKACETHGMTLIDLQLHARRPSHPEELLKLFEVFHTAERPLLMHCKSGADRTGLAAALYLIGIEGRPVSEARKQLSLRYVHLKNTATGICDHFLDVYEARNARSPIGIEEWIRTEYDPAVLAESFAARRRD